MTNSNLVCTKCHQEKEAKHFYKANKTTRKFSYWCKPCVKLNNKKYNTNLTNNKRRVERVAWLRQLKNKPCMDCENVFDPICMDFDHIVDKYKSISRMVLDNAPKDAILKEIEKCELVCVICHNRRTQKRLNKTPVFRKGTARNISIINKKKDVPCVVCGKKYESFNMHFDHIKGDKFKDVCQLKNFKLDVLLAEISKCQVLCALCHRLKSVSEQKRKISQA